MRFALGMALCFCLILLPGPVLAQQTTPTKWGVTFGAAPWQVPPSIGEFFDVSQLDIKGLDIEVGILRGKITGGDWGVSFVHKKVNDGSMVRRGGGSFCVGSFGCVQTGTTYAARGMTLNGVKVHKFFNFGTIKRRVQIGLNLAGGAAQVSGTVDKTTEAAKYTLDQSGRLTGISLTNTTTQVPAQERYRLVFSSFNRFFRKNQLC